MPVCWRSALVFLGMGCHAAHAAEETTFLGPDIVVTASRFADFYADKPVNITILDREDIERYPGKSLPEILSSQAGINSRDLFGNTAPSATVDVRGFGATAAQNTLILLDGQQLNDIDLSAIQWGAIPMEFIERIEILRGNASVLYGAGAVGGVINIITKNPAKNGNQTGLGYLAGGYDTQGAQVFASLRRANIGLNLTMNQYDSDGYRENNHNDQFNITGGLYGYLDRGEISLKFGADSQDLRLPGARIVQPSIGLNELKSDRDGTNTPLDYSSRDGAWLDLNLLRHQADFDFMVDLFYRSKEQKSYFDFGGFPDYRVADLNILSLEPRVKIHLAMGDIKSSVIAGADFEHWDYELRVSNSPANIAQPINHIDANQDNLALYVQSYTTLSRQTTLSLGLRGERFRLRARDTFDPAAPGALFGSAAPPGSQSETEYAYDVGLRHTLNDKWTLFGRVGRGFRFATVDEIYEFSPTFARQFQFLFPQKSTDQEVGIEFARPLVALRANLYHMRVKDEIHLDPYSTGIGNTNLPPLTRYGVELQAHADVGAFSLSANFTLAVAKFNGGTLNGVNLDGNTVPLVPRRGINTQAVWNVNQHSRLNALYHYVSEQYMDNDEPNTLGKKIPAYSVVDVSFKRESGPWTGIISVQNLFDKDYYNYAVRSSFIPDRYAVYPLPERNVTFSFKYAF